jgi:hypothetical protein
VGGLNDGTLDPCGDKTSPRLIRLRSRNALVCMKVLGNRLGTGSGKMRRNEIMWVWPRYQDLHGSTWRSKCSRVGSGILEIWWSAPKYILEMRSGRRMSIICS